MTTPESRAATSAAVGALTDFLVEMDAGVAAAGRALPASSWSTTDGVGALAQGYYGLLNLSALLLPLAAAHEGLAPRELLSQIALVVARDPDAL